MDTIILEHAEDSKRTIKSIFYIFISFMQFLIPYIVTIITISCVIVTQKTPSIIPNTHSITQPIEISEAN